MPRGQLNTFLGLPCHCSDTCSTYCGRTAVTWCLIAMRGVGQLMSNWYSLLRTQHQPLFLTVHSLLNVILPLLVMAKLSLERTTAVWSEFIREGLRLCLCLVTTRSSFPTTRKVSYFLNPLILVRTCPQLRVETIIKEEFEPVISSDLLCLRVEWVFFFLRLQSVSATSAASSGF